MNFGLVILIAILIVALWVLAVYAGRQANDAEYWKSVADAYQAMNAEQHKSVMAWQAEALRLRAWQESDVRAADWWKNGPTGEDDGNG